MAILSKIENGNVRFHRGFAPGLADARKASANACGVPHVMSGGTEGAMAPLDHVRAHRGTAQALRSRSAARTPRSSASSSAGRRRSMGRHGVARSRSGINGAAGVHFVRSSACSRAAHRAGRDARETVRPATRSQSAGLPRTGSLGVAVALGESRKEGSPMRKSAPTRSGPAAPAVASVMILRSWCSECRRRGAGRSRSTTP